MLIWPRPGGRPADPLEAGDCNLGDLQRFGDVVPVAEVKVGDAFLGSSRNLATGLTLEVIPYI